MTRIARRGLLIAFCAAFVILMPATGARSADSPRLPSGVSCDDVRSNVKRYGERLALWWARANGLTDAEIREAKRCLLRR